MNQLWHLGPWFTKIWQTLLLSWHEPYDWKWKVHQNSPLTLVSGESLGARCPCQVHCHKWSIPRSIPAHSKQIPHKFEGMLCVFRFCPISTNLYCQENDCQSVVLVCFSLKTSHSQFRNSWFLFRWACGSLSDVSLLPLPKPFHPTSPDCKKRQTRCLVFSRNLPTHNNVHLFQEGPAPQHAAEEATSKTSPSEHTGSQATVKSQAKQVNFFTQVHKKNVSQKWSAGFATRCMPTYCLTRQFLGDLRWVAWFGLKWAKSVRAKSKHLQQLDTGQLFWLICGYCYETMCKSSIWSNFFHLGVC